MTSLHIPRRIVSLQPSATAILQAIGQLDRLVACTRYCVDICPGAASGRIVVSDSWSADAAQIIAAKPDLVIAAVPYQEKSVAEILKTGVRFLGLAPRTLADIYTDIAMIAGIAGVPDRGQQVADRMGAAISEVRAQTAGLPRRRVFCEEWGKPLIASQMWVSELVQAAGGEFVGAPGKQTTAETVFDASPEVIIAALVRRRRPRSPSENHARSRVDPSAGGRSGPGLLHPRRIAQHTRAHPHLRSARFGCRHPP